MFTSKPGFLISIKKCMSACTEKLIYTLHEPVTFPSSGAAYDRKLGETGVCWRWEVAETLSC